jgi:hypothetical protein
MLLWIGGMAQIGGVAQVVRCLSSNLTPCIRRSKKQQNLCALPCCSFIFLTMSCFHLGRIIQPMGDY